jgi:copper resistance protein B
MSTSRILKLAAALIAFATGAAAQTPAATDHPAAMPGLQPGGAVQPVQDQEIFAHVIFSQLEGRTSGTDNEFRWEGQGWVGTDLDKLWIKSEGTLQGNGTLDDGQHQFLYDRAITTFFDLQGGLRSDIDTRPTRNWAAFGIQGLAPYFFDLEPQIEVNVYSKADRARLVGPGFSDIDTGLRLRYEFSRKFAPYLGVVYEGKFGQTANFARRAGESTSDFRFVFGVRLWL